MENMEIPLSKNKLMLTFAGSLLFVGLGIWFVLKPATFANPILHTPRIVFVVGLAAILFFGLCAVVIFRKLFDKRMGLIINNEGITDNSSGISGGLILWSDVTGISTAQVQSQKFILIMVTNPERYIDAQTGAFKKRMMKINYRMYQTPLCISANGLQCNFDELYQAITNNFKKYRSQ